MKEITKIQNEVLKIMMEYNLLRNIEYEKIKLLNPLLEKIYKKTILKEFNDFIYYINIVYDDGFQCKYYNVRYTNIGVIELYLQPKNTTHNITIEVK